MHVYVVVALFSLGACVGCSSVEQETPDRSVAHAPSVKSQTNAAGPDQSVSQEPPTQDPSGALSLSQALERALTQNPGLKALSWDVRLAEAGEIQARLRPNPELAVEMEDIGGQGPRSGFDGTETTVTLGQTLELGDKRRARVQVASHHRQLTEWDVAEARLEVKAQTTIAFAEVVIAQAQKILAQQQVALSQELLDTVYKRVQAGKDSPVEQSKAQITLAGSQIDMAHYDQTLTGARIRLASLWAGTPTFTDAVLPADPIVMPPTCEDLETAAQSHPHLARWTDEIAQAQAQKTLAHSEGTPNVTVQAGLKRYEEVHENTAVLGVAIPLPVFNRNQGARQQAAFRLAKVRQRQQQASIEVSATLRGSHSALVTAYERIMALRDQILPGADTAFQGALTGYKQGKFGYLDVLDAQRTLYEVKKQFIEAQLDYYRTRAQLEQLVGQPLDSVNTPQ